MTPAEAAAHLRISVKTLRGHVRDGSIRYIMTGRGAKRPGKAFAMADLTEFEERRRRRDAPVTERGKPSVFKRKGSRVFEYDFWLAGRRFFGNTGCTSRSEAKVHEDQVRAEARAAVKQAGAEAPLTLDTAIGRYWIEHGRAQKNADDLKRDFRRLMDRLGPQRLLSDITDDDVAKLVAWRRGHHVHDDPNRPLISNAQVNRTVTEMLRRLFVRARKKWKSVDPNRIGASTCLPNRRSVCASCARTRTPP